MLLVSYVIMVLLVFFCRYRSNIQEHRMNIEMNGHIIGHETYIRSQIIVGTTTFLCSLFWPVTEILYPVIVIII